MLVNTTCSESFETLSKLLIWVVKDFRLSVLAWPLVSRSSWWLRMPKMQQENAALNSSLNFPVNHKKDSWKKLYYKPCFNKLYRLEKSSYLKQNQPKTPRCSSNAEVGNHNFNILEKDRKNITFVRRYVRYGMKPKLFLARQNRQTTMIYEIMSRRVCWLTTYLKKTSNWAIIGLNDWIITWHVKWEGMANLYFILNTF